MFLIPISMGTQNNIFLMERVAHNMRRRSNERIIKKNEVKVLTSLINLRSLDPHSHTRLTNRFNEQQWDKKINLGEGVSMFMHMSTCDFQVQNIKEQRVARDKQRSPRATHVHVETVRGGSTYATPFQNMESLVKRAIYTCPYTTIEIKPRCN